MFAPDRFHLSALTAGFGLFASCIVTAARVNSRRLQLIAVLEHELQANTGWVQVHAADALIDHGEKETIARFFAPFAEQPTAVYRVGVWRALAHSAGNQPNREVFIQKIRSILRDPKAPDFLSATETLAKMGAADAADEDLLQKRLQTADEAAAPFIRWLLISSSAGSKRADQETALAALLDSSDVIARLRAAAALKRIDSLSSATLERLRQQTSLEPGDSMARVYVISANLCHHRHNGIANNLKPLLLPYLNGKPNEQLEAASALGRFGNHQDRPALNALLNSPEADGRIGAASGLLYLLQ